MQITTIGIDLAKTVFQIHAVDADGATVIRKRLIPRAREPDSWGIPKQPQT
jgi:hypothetical protein